MKSSDSLVMKTISLLFFSSVFAFALGAVLSEVRNGYAKAPNDPKVLRISVIDGDKAVELFKEFARDKDIPFKYPEDGCYARATAMARIAEKDHIYMGKVFAEGDLQGAFKSRLYPLEQWGFHVAPMAFVKGADGTKHVMVFDPSLFKKPVTIREWKAKMLVSTPDYKASLQRIYFGSRFQYYSISYAHEKYKSDWSQEDLADMKMRFQSYLPLQDLSVTNPPEADKSDNRGHR